MSEEEFKMRTVERLATLEAKVENIMKRNNWVLATSTSGLLVIVGELISRMM